MFDCQLALMLMVVAGVVAALPCAAEPTKDPDGKTLWYDCRDLLLEGKAWADTAAPYDRLPASAKGVVPDSVWGLSHHSAGLCARFTTDSPTVRVQWTLLDANLAMTHMAATGVSGVDLYARHSNGKWRFIGNGRPEAMNNDVTFYPGAHVECLLYFPLYNGVTSVKLGVPVGSKITSLPGPHGKAAKPVLFYGTSITQGGCASRPGTAYTAIAGRLVDRPVINLGFSGSGKMEPALADLLGQLDVAVYVLDCLWNMTPDEVTERAEPFIKRLRAARPATPILMAEDCNYLDAVPTGKGEQVRAIVAKLTAAGVPGLHFLSAKGMLGDDSEGTVDGCHPTDLGMMRQAEVFAAGLMPLLKTP
jgi:lysophospholipase L1-like esterase